MLELPASEGLIPVAQYNRMSTDNQDYSISYQQEWNDGFAGRHGMKIAATYADHGKSGLSLRRRTELQRLLNDVRSGNVTWKAILVFDVTRWGRFQDPDESAFYEWTCKMAGFPVIYTAESFDESGGPANWFHKFYKRMMAGSYSQDLSVKTYAGQKIGTEKGLWASGRTGYGLRRATADDDGNPVRVLESGEWTPKNRHACVVLGPPDEVTTVRRIFRMYVEERRTVATIVAMLNAERVPGPRGSPWYAGVIYSLLRNEKYIGTLVWGRRSAKLQTPRIRIPPDKWIRVPNAFPAIVQKEIFERAQTLIGCFGMPTDERMLEGLRRLLKRKGRLSVDIIKKARDVPSATAYRNRFGSASNLYALVGYSPPPRRVNEFAARRRARRVALSDELAERLRATGADVTQKPSGARLTVNGMFVIAICVVYGSRHEGVRQRWIVSSARTPRDLTVVARMDPDFDRVIDYYVVPDIAFSHCRVLRIGQTRGVSPLESYRRENLIGIENMVECWSPRPVEDEIEGLDE